MRLDRSKPHGEIYGDTRFAFEQNGVLFRGDGMPVDGNGTPLPVVEQEEPAPAPVKAKGSKAAKPAVEPLASGEDTVADEQEIDLVAWRDGKTVYAWAVIVAAIQRKYDVVVNTKQEAMDIINKNFPAPATA